MKPRMTDAEFRLFANVLACAENYLEFGCGGSTVAAAERVGNSIISVDSARDWIDEVAGACAQRPTHVQPSLHYIDIGPIGNWGFPVDPSTRGRWPDYHERIWENAMAAAADLYMVDGRFRVACCAQIALHCRSEALIVIHDYTERPDYHVVTTFLRPIARSESLWVFQRRRDHDPNAVRGLLAEYKCIPE